MTTGGFQASEFHWQLSGDELDDMTVVSQSTAVSGRGFEAVLASTTGQDCYLLTNTYQLAGLLGMLPFAFVAAA